MLRRAALWRERIKSSRPSREIDLHLHTLHSDGRLSPTAVVIEAAARGLSAIAITDHDVLTGLPEAQNAARQNGIEVVSGIELSADWDGRTVHLLGYFIDPGCHSLVRALCEKRERVIAHVEHVLGLLEQLGERLEPSDLERIRSRYISGAALVLALVQRGTLRRVPRPRELLRMAAGEPRSMPVEAALELIHAAGGVAVLAHPVRVFRRQPLLRPEDLAGLVSAGLDGIEAWQVVHDDETRLYYQRLASRMGLVAAGGSDCHGPTRRGMRLGSQRVPESVLSELRAVRARRAEARN